MYVLFFARGYENKENYIISNMVANRQVQPGSQVGLQRRHEIETIHSLVNGCEIQSQWAWVVWGTLASQGVRGTLTCQGLWVSVTVRLVSGCRLEIVEVVMSLTLTLLKVLRSGTLYSSFLEISRSPEWLTCPNFQRHVSSFKFD